MGMTKEEIENIRRNGVHAIKFSDRTDKIIELCDLALRALSLESVREEMAQLCLDIGEQEMIRTGRVAAARTYQIGCENCAEAIRATLQHAPARVAEGDKDSK